MTTKQDWVVDPLADPLKSKQAKAAYGDLIVDYPKIVRSHSDNPVPQQQYGLVSWMLFKEPKILPNGDPVYGVFKIRGNYSDVDLAKSRAADIVRSQDSRNKVHVVNTGAWFPITNNLGASQDVVNVDVDDPGAAIRAAAAKENEAEQDRIKRELKERKDEVLSGADYHDDPESLTFYTMTRVTWMGQLERLEQLKKEAENVEKKLAITRKLLHSLEKNHPEYTKQWIEHWNVERRRAGIPDVAPTPEQTAQYEKFDS